MRGQWPETAGGNDLPVKAKTPASDDNVTAARTQLRKHPASGRWRLKAGFLARASSAGRPSRGYPVA